MFLSFPIALIVLVVCIVFISAGTKKGSKWIDKKPKRIKTLTSDKSVDEIFKKIIKFGQTSSYSIDAMDENKKVVVFSEKGNFIHMGFFFPVYISTENNSTKIEIGIQGKSKEFKSVLEKNLESFITTIKVVLFETE